MSYDLEICVKVEGIDRYARIAEPELSSPTYNLSAMFAACMDWDYEQGQYYRCDEVINYVEHGIRELRTNRKEYEQYNSPNGWGDLDGAIRVLESLRKCIYECVDELDIPLDCLWMRW